MTLCTGPVLSQSYEDKRCLCVCSNPAFVLNDTQSTNRQLYIANVPPDKCNCEMVVLPHVGISIKGRGQALCPQCECKYEMRNTRVIMIVVILVLWLLMLLSIYMAFIMCLDPLMKKKKPSPRRYREDGTEEACSLLAQEDIENLT
ncbi:proton-transporting V-type ATPase complex assembly regulator TMEM9-like isoform X2 [Plodia interpunctella]|uniref:proton-transporting V-type ATPase complex assembly regulator TMEM9-like isoform X2 n=1 Tax=Plodia interpunctella TaxID=58824 RepID=UPI00236811D7|nr:proton-transporting V-type ATPase complex assembly regulator TMEM9-like isoform X2 [Plodia interpunctella]